MLAIPLEHVCTRCGGRHARSRCTHPCERCGHEWPEHTQTCEHRYDVSETRLMATCHQTHPRVMTTDLEGGERFQPLAGTSAIVAVSTSSPAISSSRPDIDEDGYEVMLRRYAPHMPRCLGMAPEQWLTIADDQQIMRICSAVAMVERRAAGRMVVDPATEGRSLLWDDETQAELTAAFQTLHRTVQVVAAEVAELVTRAMADNE